MSRGRRRSDFGASTARHVVGVCAIILTLTMSAIALVQSYTTRDVITRRGVTVDALDAYGKRQECFNALLSDQSAALAEAAAAPEGTPERAAAREHFIVAGTRLRDQRALCIDPFPLPQEPER